MFGVYAFLVGIVFIVIVINFAMLYNRLKRDKKLKREGIAMSEPEASRWREKEIQRRLDREQEEAVKRVDLRNKTLELYEQVRRNAAAAENESGGMKLESNGADSGVTDPNSNISDSAD